MGTAISAQYCLKSEKFSTDKSGFFLEKNLNLIPLVEQILGIFFSVDDSVTINLSLGFASDCSQFT